jgi:iron complex outermembrane recepter protein
MQGTKPIAILGSVGAAAVFMSWAALAAAQEPDEPAAPVPDTSAEHEVPEVVVAGARADIPLKESPTGTTIVDPTALRAVPRGIGAEEAFRLVPGVKVDNQADGERVHMSIRGQGLLTERGIRGIKVFIDGVPLNDPTGFVPDLFDVDWTNVRRIEVIRGPASALYGGAAAGGIINITTKDDGNEPIGGDGSFTTGAYDFWKGYVGAGGKESSLKYHLALSRTSGDGYRNHTAFNATNFYGKTHWEPSASVGLTAIAAATDFFNENAEGLNLGWLRADRRQANPDSLTYNEFQRTRRATVGLVGRAGLDELQDMTWALYYRHTLWTESVPSTIQDRTYRSPGGSAQYNLHIKSGAFANHTSLGCDFDYQSIADRKHPNLGGAIAGDALVADQSIAQSGLGLVLVDRLELGPQWALVGGARYDRVTNRLTDKLALPGADLSGSANFAKVTARVGLAWNPLKELGAYANWGQGFVPPATEELANNPDALGGFNAHLVPAVSMGEELGIRGQIADVAEYEVAGFRVDTDNDFGRYRVATRPLETFYQNAGSTRKYGVEVGVGIYPVSDLRLQVAYTYSHFRYTSVRSLFGDFTDQTMPNSPTHQLSADAEYVLAHHWVLGLGTDGASRSYVDQTNTLTAPGYMLLHARAAYRWSVQDYRAELGVWGRNILGTRYIAFTEPDPDGNSFQPGPTQEFFAGARIALGR